MNLWKDMALEYSALGLGASEITERIYSELGLEIPYNTVKDYIWRKKKRGPITAKPEPECGARALSGQVGWNNHSSVCYC